MGTTDCVALVAVIVLSVLLVAFSCEHRRGDRLSFIDTPQGYRCAYRDEGTILSGKATIEQIWAWHSQAVDRAVKELAALGKTPEDEIRRRARGVAYRLIDNCAYEVEGSGVWATGRWVDYLNTIEVCLYTRIQGTKDQIPESAPPWTVRQNPKNPSEWRWGVLLAGREFPALRHELGHALYGPGFEH